MGKKQDFSINVTSKMKKKLKVTQKKLTINKNEIKTVINYLKKESSPNYNEHSPIYLYIILKDEIKDEENLKKIKNKLIKLKHSLISEELEIKQCLLEDNLNDNEKIDLVNLSPSMDILSNEELTERINELKDNNCDINNLNYLYQIFISNSKYNLFQKNNINKSCDIIYYQKKNLDKLKAIIKKIEKGSSIIKILNKKNIFRIKCGYVKMTENIIYENINNMIYKSICFLLSNSQKYNTIEGIIIKTDNSIPFKIFGEIKSDYIKILKNK